MTTENNFVQEPAGDPAGKAMPGGRKLSLPTLFNLLMLLGLIVLYVLYFTCIGNNRESRDMVRTVERLSENVSSIAYVNSEVLMEGYELAIRMRADFDAEQKRMENDLTRRQRTFQSDVERFQRNISTGTISVDQAQIREQELMQMQQELMQLTDTYREQLAMKEFEMNRELLESIADFLSRYNRETGHDYILAYTMGGGILYADPLHDITSAVLERLNQEFRSKK